MLELIERETIKYQTTADRIIRKNKGQFFTPLNISRYMASLINVDKEEVKVLDCGAGSGILGFSVLDNLLKNNNVKSIHIDFYENDIKILPTLYANIKEADKKLKTINKNIVLNVIEENFILYNSEKWRDKNFLGEYDIAIANPPYKKIPKSNEESIAMDDIVYGQPNEYFLFMAMSMHMLKNDGEAVFITPRSFTSGAYFLKFREYMLDVSMITNIHIFNSRSDVFSGEKVLQESIITRFVKKKNIERIKITSTNAGAFISENNVLNVDYNLVIDMNTRNKFILIPSSNEEINILNIVHSWSYNLRKLGFQLKTGPIVDFRNKDYITNNPSNAVPLIWSDNFVDDFVREVDNSDNYRFILDTEKTKGMLLENKNYLLVKRFTSKEEKRRLQPALYIKENFSKYDKVGIENHINYITKLNGKIELDELYGLFCLFNSTILDKYYRIVNGSTQVNATETNLIPLPGLEQIKLIGSKLYKEKDTSADTCDKIIDLVLMK